MPKKEEKYEKPVAKDEKGRKLYDTHGSGAFVKEGQNLGEDEAQHYEAKPMEPTFLPNGQAYFDPEEGNPTWDPGYTVGVFGARGTGKSFWSRWFMWVVSWAYPVVYVFTETKMNCFWKAYINEEFIFEGYQEDKLYAIMKDQMQKVDAFLNGANINPYCLIVWDDCLPNDIQYDPLFRQIFFNGRHYRIGNLMCTQYFYAIPKKYRGNLDWVVTLKQNQRAQIEGFFEEMSYAGKGKDNFNNFNKMFVEATRDNNVIVFDVRDQSKLPTEKIYTMKAEDPGIFWMGSALYWSNNIKGLQEIMSGKALEKTKRQVPWKSYGMIDVWDKDKDKKKKEDKKEKKA